MKKHRLSIRFFEQRKKLAIPIVSFVLGVITGCILFFLCPSGDIEPLCIAEGKATPSKSKEFSTEKEILPSKNITKTTKQTLTKDDTLYNILRKNHVSPKEIADLLTASKKIYNLNKIRPGNTLELEIRTDDNTINCFKYEIDEDNILVIEKSAKDFFIRKERIKYDIKISAKGGTITNSLFESVVAAGLPPHIALDLADIFAWQIDSHTDIRQGDTFKVLFEQKYRDGNFIKNGKILCAEFVNQGDTFWAILFEDKDGHVDYYNLQGDSLYKQFLKSPLRYRRISSSYSKRRFHPILKVYRPHLGIDFAAPIGTPVVSVGDGKVVFTGWKSGYGKFIKIRHNGTYSTTYGHLSRFAKGIKSRRYVKQGQVIGYVGSTGLSTGPHLDYRLLKNGKFINPMKCNFPSARSLRKRYVKDFDLVKEEMVNKLKWLGLGETVYGG